MFTGIITDLGEIREIQDRGDRHISVNARTDLRTMPIGASVACSGICLTVVDKGEADDPWFAVTVSKETVSKTTAGSWSMGTLLNLERPVRVGDELGGHIVTGHVDSTATLTSVTPEGESLRMSFTVQEGLAAFIAPKGSVALDGVSLTVNEVQGARFGVNVIPHTRRATTLGELREGSRVNVEIDLIARYVQRLMRQP